MKVQTSFCYGPALLPTHAAAVLPPALPLAAPRVPPPEEQRSSSGRAPSLARPSPSRRPSSHSRHRICLCRCPQPSETTWRASFCPRSARDHHGGRPEAGGCALARWARPRRRAKGDLGLAPARRCPPSAGLGTPSPGAPSPAMLPEPPLSSRPRRHCAPEAGARGDRVGRVPAPATALGVGATGAQARWPPLDKPFQLEKFITDLETAAAVTSLRGTSAIKNPSVLSSFSATRRQTSLWSAVGRWGRMKNFGASALVTAAGDAGGGGTPTPRPVGRGDLPRPGVQQTFLPLAPLLGPPPASAAAESTTSHPPTAEAAASRCSHEHPCTRSASGSVWFRRKRGGGREF